MNFFKQLLLFVRKLYIYIKHQQIVHRTAVIILSDSQQTCQVFLLFRPHRNGENKMRPIATYLAWSICVSVCLLAQGTVTVLDGVRISH